MRSLFLRVFISFWAAMALIVAGAIAVTMYALAERAEEMPRRPTRVVHEAAAALERGGRAELERWLRGHVRGHDALQTFVVDESGRELLGRPLPRRHAHRMMRHEDEEPRGWIGPHTRWLPSRPAPVLIGPAGDRYAFLFVPRRPGILGPLGLPEARFGTLALALIVTGLASWLLARSVTRPVGRVSEAARAIAAGRLDTRVAEGIGARRDEIGVLAREFDTMAERVRALLAGRERLLRDVSHELRSPLARLQVALGLARQAGADAGLQLDRIEREAGRLEALIAQVLRLSRLDAAAEQARREPVDLGDLVRSVAHDAQFEADPGGVAVGVEAAATPVSVRGDPELLRSAIENVVRNAVRYTDPRRGIGVRCMTEGPFARVIVRDHGPGVPDADLERIFEPFYRVAVDRTRDSGGDGIGLAITARVLKSHGGRAQARNAEGGGLEVVLELPLAECAAA
jgi:two-component system sensor histidine kinase CpxA